MLENTMIGLSEEQMDSLTRVLRQAGWYEGRSIDMEAKIAALQQGGWNVFEAAREFMAGFCNIEPIEIDGRSKIYLGAIHGEEDPEVAVDWKRTTGENIFPIGFHGIVALFLEESGKIYDNVEDAGAMSLLGENLYVGLYNLLFGAPINTVYYETS